MPRGQDYDFCGVRPYGAYNSLLQALALGPGFERPQMEKGAEFSAPHLQDYFFFLTSELGKRSGSKTLILIGEGADLASAWPSLTSER